jgi:hypothetical protein
MVQKDIRKATRMGNITLRAGGIAKEAFRNGGIERRHNN